MIVGGIPMLLGGAAGLVYVGGNSGGVGVGDTAISLTALTGGIASAAAAGDVVIACYNWASTADKTLSITDGTNPYTLLGSELYSNDSRDANLRAGIKALTAADASVTFGGRGTGDAAAAALHVWRGVHATPLDVSVVTATGIDTGRPDAAAITPVTSGAVIVVIGGGTAAAASGINFTASELANFVTTNSSNDREAVIGIGSYLWGSGAFNPAQWGGVSTNAADAATTSDSWAAITLALRPA